MCHLQIPIGIQSTFKPGSTANLPSWSTLQFWQANLLQQYWMTTVHVLTFEPQHPWSNYPCAFHCALLTGTLTRRVLFSFWSNCILECRLKPRCKGGLNLDYIQIENLLIGTLQWPKILKIFELHVPLPVTYYHVTGKCMLKKADLKGAVNVASIVSAPYTIY